MQSWNFQFLEPSSPRLADACVYLPGSFSFPQMQWSYWGFSWAIDRSGEQAAALAAEQAAHSKTRKALQEAQAAPRPIPFQPIGPSPQALQADLEKERRALQDTQVLLYPCLKKGPFNHEHVHCPNCDWGDLPQGCPHIS